MIAALVHDWLVREFSSKPAKYSWTKSAAIMRNIMRAFDRDKRSLMIKRRAAYWAVRFYGLWKK